MAKIDIHNSQTWLSLARQAGYRASLLAKNLEICSRQVRRYTRQLFGCTPRE